MNRDKLSNLKVRKAANAAMLVIDTMQQLPPEEQIAGLAAAFLLLADRVKMSPQEMFSFTTSIMNHADGRRPEFAAVAQYMDMEL